MHASTLRRVLIVALGLLAAGALWFASSDARSGGGAASATALDGGATSAGADAAGSVGTPRTAPDLRATGADAGQAPTVTATDPLRRAAAAPSEAVQVELELADGLDGLLMAPPYVAVTDANGERRGLLTLDRSLTLESGAHRVFGLQATSPGWEVLSPSIVPTPEGPNQVRVRSRSALWLTVRDAATGAAVPRFDVAVETQWIEGCCPTGIQSSPLSASTDRGAVAIEGLDLRAPIEAQGTSKARASVTVDGYLQGTSEWVPLVPGLVSVELELEPDPTQVGSLEVLIVDNDGQPIAGVEVTAFDEDPAAPIVDVYHSGSSWEV
ncbi:MAG: hypothetical protein AAFZ65_09745, partial [Planctomycetota bacterium]